MNSEELAFVNRQLAAMLREGIPLEGSLRQLCLSMRRGRLRSELEALEASLAQGEPLGEALARRKLPPLYTQMAQLGARTNDLPAMLTLLADYYQNANMIWTRLKGLMVYPVFVMLASCGFSVWIAILMDSFLPQAIGGAFLPPKSHIQGWYSPLGLWMPPVILGICGVGVLGALSLPHLRRELWWRLPAFKEANLSRVGSAMAMLLKGGCSLAEALELLQQMESGTRAGAELGRWKLRCAEGHARFSAIARDSRVFPPMFIWLVSGAEEDLATGFERAARAYHERAAYRTQVLLYASLPCAVLFVGLLILVQIYPVASVLFSLPRLFM